MFSVIGELPRHRYVWVDPSFIKDGSPLSGFVPAVWFGLVSIPSRAWGLTVLLECGAVYRNLPPHAISFNSSRTLLDQWDIDDAQTWNCYGERFSCLEYSYLSAMRVKAKTKDDEIPGSYLFTAIPIGDGFSAYPEQAKEFSFIELDNGRLTIQPTNHILFEDKSFTTNKEMVFPTDLRRQNEIWSCE